MFWWTGSAVTPKPRKFRESAPTALPNTMVSALGRLPRCRCFELYFGEIVQGDKTSTQIRFGGLEVPLRPNPEISENRHRRPYQPKISVARKAVTTYDDTRQWESALSHYCSARACCICGRFLIMSMFHFMHRRP